MKIAVMSDLHGYLPEWEVYCKELEDVEVLLICGDIIPTKIQTNIPESEKWLKEKFKTWIDSLPIEKCFFIAGNHDFIFERSHKKMKDMFKSFDKATYLCNESTIYTSNLGDSYTIFGTPYCKYFGNWAFMRDDDKLAEYYSYIPVGVDILISHDAPRIKGLGCILQEGYRWYGEEAGSQVLADAIMEKKPKYCFCGHIHSGQHELQELDGVKMANASVVNERYELVHEPLILYV